MRTATFALTICSLVAAALSSAACDGPVEPAGPVELAVDLSNDELGRVFFRSPLPEPPVDTTNRWHSDEAAAQFGQRLFFDTRLSIDDNFSCASCHDPDLGFGDERRFSDTIAPTGRHAPHLWNIVYQRWFFWDGRADSMWSQAIKPIESPIEMGNDRVNVIRTVASEADLRAEYEAVFEDLPPVDDMTRFPAHAMPVPSDSDGELNQAWEGMSEADREAINRAFSNLGKAMAAYEAKLISRRSRFDVFVEGLRENDQEKVDALSASEQRGLKLFVGHGKCFLCHLGPQFSDKEFHNIGLDGDGGIDYGRFLGVDQVIRSEFNALGPYSDDTEGDKADNLRFLIATPEAEGAFKTPGLRNIALNPPYMHDGRFATLKDVVHYYNVLDQSPPVGHREDSLQPLELEDSEEDDLVGFLESLTDIEVDQGLLQPPSD